jgi:hypothetical protein
LLTGRTLFEPSVELHHVVGGRDGELAARAEEEWFLAGQEQEGFVAIGQLLQAEGVDRILRELPRLPDFKAVERAQHKEAGGGLPCAHIG